MIAPSFRPILIKLAYAAYPVAPVTLLFLLGVSLVLGTCLRYAIVMATLSTVLPVFLVAEALKRIGANHFAAGPVTIAVAVTLGLEEPLNWLQAAGGALVIFGVLLVSTKRS